MIFDQVFLAYSKNEPSVLKNITFAVKPAEKVIYVISVM
jgi:ABC-type multidrug transport system fused ATPase/permease subunit